MAEDNTPRLYSDSEVDQYGNVTTVGYAYGEPWVAQALLMGDIKFATPEEAKAWWERNYAI